MTAGLGRSLPVWADACRFGQKPAGLGRCLPVWADACRVNQWMTAELSEKREWVMWIPYE